MARSGATRRVTAVTLALSAMLTACWSGGDDDAADPPPTTDPADAEEREPTEPVVNIEGVPLGADGASAPLGFRLSEGSPIEQAPDPIELVAGEPIPPERVAEIFERLAPWDVPADDVTEFRRPPQSLPPPLVGNTVETAFPPPPGDATPVDPERGPLEVLRFQPEGEVAVAPFLSVTFNQPMVPIGTLDQLDAADVPIVVTPAIEGRWRWIGTRTLRFEVIPGDTDRLPAATEYQVVVPAGTESVTGSTLADDVTWSFSTPPPEVTRFHGADQTTGLEPVFVAVFDQVVDKAAVVASISMRAGGDAVRVRIVTNTDLDADDQARAVFDAAQAGRAVAFRPEAPLPPDTDFTIDIGPGTPSAEGPRTTTSAQTFTGSTFGSLGVAETGCGPPCAPGTPFRIVFSNALDPQAFAADQLEISPGIPDLNVNVYGNAIELFGRTSGRTTYAVTLDGGMQDVFGQTLGEDVTVDFEVGSAPPELIGLQREWITLDPSSGTQHVSVTTVNHDGVRVKAWAVTPADLEAYRTYLDAQWSDTDPPEPDWPVVLDELVEIDADRDEYVETVVDLSSAFAQAGSQLVVRIDPPEPYRQNDDDYWRNRPTIAWVQSTTLGIDAILDHDTLVIWTTDLATGEPVDGVPVELIGDGRIATTDGNGLATLELGSAGIRGLWASVGDRESLLTAGFYEGWRSSTPGDESRWYVFDDRGIYRPGETVRITGWVRRFARSQSAQLEVIDEASEVSYTVWDPQGTELASGAADLNALGGFNLAIELPDDANLGQAYAELRVSGGQQTSHIFAIQEFRRPEFEVTVANESPGPFYAAAPATVRVNAEYFSGGPLPGAAVEWLVSTRNTTYRPPNWDEYSFGIWVPWWSFGRLVDDSFAADIAFSEPCLDCWPGTETEFEKLSGVTDASGSHYLQIDFDGPEVDLPKNVTAEATVFDVNRQAWADRTDLVVHPARQYVGLRSDRGFVRQGDPLRVEAVVTDVDGVVVPDRPVEVTAGRVEWVFEGGEYIERLADEQVCTFVSTADAGDESMQCEFSTDVGGTYRVTAIVTDEDGRTNRSELTVWVSGGEGRPSRGVDQESVTIVPDADSYAPGDTAELLVQAPFSPATGIVTISRAGIVSTEAFDAADGSAVVEIPIDEAWIPNVTVQVDMVGTDVRTTDDGAPQPDLPRRPAYATGRIDLPIPPVTRTLDVVATPAADAVEPGTETSVRVTVSGPDGQPVAGADVAIVVVDEAVLALTGYELADPLDVFYQQVWSQLEAAYMRSSILLTRSDLLARDGNSIGAPTTTTAYSAEDTAEMSEETEGDDAAGGARTALGVDPTIDVRSNFDALALYAPDESTGEDGTVTVNVSIPDSLTRYRVMAVAVDGADHFGKGESTITARLPLQVRPSAPRFLNFGDRFELPVVLQNQTEEPREVEVVVQTSNLSASGTTGKLVTVPANDRIEVRFDLAADQVGTARFRVAAISGDFADAAAIELPVYTPATAEAFATYGVVDDGAIAQPVLAPTGVYPQFGGLEINTSSTALQALTDAVLYLTEYRYESADSLASRIMAIATLRDVLDAFDAEGLPASTEITAAVRRDLAKLVELQNDDGGWPYWRRGLESIPWVSIQTTHALVLAKQADYTFSDDTLRRALDHLASIEQHFPATYDEATKNTLSAYALYVRGEAGERDVAKATALYERAGDDLELDAVAWLWPSIDDADLRSEIQRRFENAAVETAGAATFATSYGEDAYLVAHSERRSDGVILDALISEAPDSDVIPKVVAGLLGGQTRGRWNNAQDNAFILVALHDYFAAFESVTPEFVARAWLGDTYALEHEFSGRSTDRVHTLVPMDVAIAAGDTTVVLAKEGAGRLYYRLGLRYAPTDLQLDPRDEGFIVDRVYEAVDDPDDVRRNADGSWAIKAGASVRVKLTMVADARRTHMALLSPLPAGLEAVNPSLAVSQTIPPAETGSEDGSDEGPVVAESSWWWGWNWFEHQNLRDDRVEAFSSFLPAGTYEYSFVARATTPGTFVVPPARAEEIYAPEVFGRSASEIVVVS